MKPSQCQNTNQSSKSNQTAFSRFSLASAVAFSTSLAPFAAPITEQQLEQPEQQTEQQSGQHSGQSTAPSPARLGQFLREQIEDRLEPVSGHPWSQSEKEAFSATLAEAIAEAAYEQNIDAFLLLSMVEVESRYNTQAVGLHGERGLVQIKPSTASWITKGVECDLHEAHCNIMAGATYLSYLTNRTERRRAELDEPLPSESLRLHILRSYNEGPARADRLSIDAPAPIPYATKIANRAARFRSQFLVRVLNSEGRVTTVAKNQ